MDGLHQRDKSAERKLSDTGKTGLQYDRERAELQGNDTAQDGRQNDRVQDRSMDRQGFPGWGTDMTVPQQAPFDGQQSAPMMGQPGMMQGFPGGGRGMENGMGRGR